MMAGKKIIIDPSMIRMKGDPPPEPSPEEIKMHEALAKEHSDIRDARLAVLDRWNMLEESLASILRTVVGIHDERVASILYFTPHSFRTRLDTIGKIISIQGDSESDPSLTSDWKKIAEKLGKKRNIRNLAAHGYIVSHIDEKGKNYALLAPVMEQSDAYWVAFHSGKKPGATLNEVKAAADVAEELRQEVEAFHARLKTRPRFSWS
jgi:hypothetical protein